MDDLSGLPSGDARVADYARLLVERAVGVQPGWQVVINAQVLARPLIEEVQRLVARAGAYAITQLSFDIGGGAWVREAPEEILRVASGISLAVQQQADAMIAIMAPENTRATSDLPSARMSLFQESMATARERTTAMTMPWVVCQYPTPSLAQDAGMATSEFADFLYGACLLDWDAEGEKMARIASLVDEASEVRIVGEGTDLRLSVEGRSCAIDDGHINMPGGEVFLSPLETETEGTVSFSEFPAVYMGHEVEGAWLRFDGGRVVDAGARVNEQYLIEMLDTDPGARILGELGIGCNPGIQRHMKNTLFDEKIDGTIHLALGRSYTSTGGVNESAIHWDMVKDLRASGELHLDGEVVQRNGAWSALARA